MKYSVVIFLLFSFCSATSYEYNPDCWKTDRETCNEQKRINPGNLGNNPSGGSGN